VQTDFLFPGPLAPNGLPIPWLLTYFDTTNIAAGADPTGKGMTIAQDYAAGTDPANVSSALRITAESFASGGTNVRLTWESVPTRYYYIQKNSDLSRANWTDSGLGLIAPSVGSSTAASLTDTSIASRFYRLQAIKPLTP
jgi:hypothetical protein